MVLTVNQGSTGSQMGILFLWTVNYLSKILSKGIGKSGINYCSLDNSNVWRKVVFQLLFLNILHTALIEVDTRVLFNTSKEIQQ